MIATSGGEVVALPARSSWERSGTAVSPTFGRPKVSYQVSTVTGMFDEIPCDADLRLADNAIRDSLARLRITPGALVRGETSPAVDVEWLLGQLCAGRIAVARAAARLLANHPERYAGPEHQVDLAAVRSQLDGHLEHRAVRSGLPPAELVERLDGTLGRAGLFWERLGGLEEVRCVLVAEPAATRAAAARHLLSRVTGPDRGGSANAVALLEALAHADRDGAVDIAAILDWAGNDERSWFSGLDVLVLAEYAAGRPHPAALATARRTALAAARPAEALRSLWPVVNVGEPWADRAVAEVDALPAADRNAWVALLDHAATAQRARPAARWLATGRTLLAAVDPAAYAARVADWLAQVGQARSVTPQPRQGERNLNEVLDPWNVPVLRGLVWLLTLCPPGEEVIRTLGALVDTALRPVEQLGPRHPQLANTAVYALSMMEDAAAVGQLARLSIRVRYRGTLKEIEKALAVRAAALGVSRDDIDELSVPSYGLTQVGLRAVTLGGCRAEVRVSGSDVTVRWHNAAGKVVKAVPAQARRQHAADVAELKISVKEIGKMLTAQRDRLDRLMLSDRSWRWDAWRSRYLHHPLVGTLARRLIWTVDGTARCWADGALRGLDDTAPAPADDATVALWHPLGRPAAEVTAWRQFLRRHGITQPFKQAHREQYTLTDAERATETYSNRFAAHILRQHQFHALAAVRGWKDPLRLQVDDTYPPAYRELPAWGLRAEYEVTGLDDEDTTASGAFLRLTTDQLRFYPIDAPLRRQHASGGHYHAGALAEPVPLADVPQLVFSEVLRDVDLFVSAASVGHDPDWSGGGPTGEFGDYWLREGLGELRATARTRRELLAELVPLLPIADRCELTDRYLRVRGKLGRYRIHLGSSNIVAEPAERYVCIVPAHRAQPALYLPFEGDGMLTLILSKAFLLADDAAVTDPTIRRQLLDASPNLTTA